MPFFFSRRVIACRALNDAVRVGRGGRRGLFDGERRGNGVQPFTTCRSEDAAPARLPQFRFCFLGQGWAVQACLHVEVSELVSMPRLHG